MKTEREPDAGNRIRLNRYLSMCGIASRRKADDLISGGKVSLNGATVRDLGVRIDPDRDRVFVEGKQVVRLREPVYLVLNKPKDTITTLHDERGRSTIMDLVHCRDRVYPVGRLDRNTTGVLLLTNDGEFANRLMHPRFEVPKSYEVTCTVPVTREHLRQLAKGVPLDDGVTAPAAVAAIPGGKGKEVGITIREGRNRQVRRMFEKLGYVVLKLDRVAYGPVTRAGLPRGATRKLTRTELRELRRIAGMQD